MGRCICGSTTIITNRPCEQACSECFIPANHIVPVSNRVAPCGGIGIVDVAALNSFAVCSGAVTYMLYSFDTEGFNSVSITSNGLLTYELSGDAVPGTYYSIVYRARCNSDELGGYGVIQTTPLDLCQFVNCALSERCNKCNGLCEPVPIDLSINMQ